MTDSSRVQWIDYAKGIGILFVVLGHVLTDAVTHGIKLNESLYKTLVFIYSFHMPLFFFLSGLFTVKWLSKPNAISNKIKTLVFPYVAWSLIQGSISILFASEVNQKLTWDILFMKIIINPYLHLWFLYYLFFCFAIYYILDKFKITMIPVFCLSIIGILLTKNYSLPWILSELLQFFSFFVSGILFFRYNKNLNFIKKHYIYALVACCISSTYYINTLYMNQPIGYNFTSLYNQFFAYSGISFIVILSNILAKFNLVSSLKKLGSSSMAIYLIHLSIIVGLRIILNRYTTLDTNAMLYIFVISSFIFSTLFSVFTESIIKFMKIDNMLLGKYSKLQT